MSAEQTLMTKVESLNFANLKRKILLVALVYRANLAAFKQLTESDLTFITFEVPLVELEAAVQSDTQATAEYIRQLEDDGFLHARCSITDGISWTYKIDLSPLCKYKVSK